ncbi:ATP-dependent DNA helicase [Trichonephila clavipes]|nr:ATP-dependent DNA helicase [Trichonephila clavipes]
MAEDILRRVRLENGNMAMEFTEGIYNETLKNIEDRRLTIANKVLIQLGMPAPTRAEIGSFDVDLRREQSYNISDFQLYVQSNIPKLTCEQKGIYDRITQMINDGVGDLLLGCTRRNRENISHQIDSGNGSIKE